MPEPTPNVHLDPDLAEKLSGDIKHSAVDLAAHVNSTAPHVRQTLAAIIGTNPGKEAKQLHGAISPPLHQLLDELEPIARQMAEISVKATGAIRELVDGDVRGADAIATATAGDDGRQ